MHPFEVQLLVQEEDIEFTLASFRAIENLGFLLNPRRLRGSDFLMRWSQGVWSERRLIQAINATNEFYALPYGPSSTAPEGDVRAFELYFERLEAAGLGSLKRPDLLLFRYADKDIVDSVVVEAGGLEELPFVHEADSALQTLLSRALVAIECENSLWKARLMPDYGAALRPQRRLNKKPGLRKTAVLPTVILKEEDRPLLQRWQDLHLVPIHIWHLFYDLAFGISLDEAQRLIHEGYISQTNQVFQAPGGATTRKVLYKIYHHYAFHLGTAVEEPKLIAKSIVDKNGHILPYVHFEGGRLALSEPAMSMLRELSDAHI